MGIMDGVKWGIGTGIGSSIGHSIGNLVGFGTQNVNVKSETVPTSQIIKSDFDKCMETSNHEKKLSYCYEYDKCLQSKTSVNCSDIAQKATLKYDE